MGRKAGSPTSATCATSGCPGAYYASGLCKNCYYRARRETPEYKEWYYRYHLKRKFGVTDEEAARLAAISQCECCGAEPDERLHVDHDHETGEILCRRCNYALSVLDDPDLCQALDAYLAGPSAPRLQLIHGGA